LPVAGVDALSQLLDLIDTDDALEFSQVRSGVFPSALERWVGYALDVCKHILSAENATRSRLDRAEPLLSKLAKLQERGNLSKEKLVIEVNGKKRSTPSPLQRYFLQSSSYYLDSEQFDRVVEVCTKALESGAFEKDPNRKWLVHRLAKAYAVIDPTRALAYADEFIALEYKPYALMLKAELLEKLGRNDEALKEVAHSLQIITEQDLPYITANLMLIARLTSDPAVQRAHVQMTRAIRSERGWSPAPDVEAFAQEMGLRAEETAPDTEVLRSMWREINPQPTRPSLSTARSTDRHKQRISPSEIKKSFSHSEYAEFLAQTDDRGTVGLVFLPDKTGQRRRMPVVVVGAKGDQYLVGMVQKTSKHPNARPITDWSGARLKQESLFVPFYVAVPKKDLSRLGRLSEQDLEILPRAGRSAYATSSRPAS
jgi:tetratricopeptide (TPR) repeat protein